LSQSKEFCGNRETRQFLGLPNVPFFDFDEQNVKFPPRGHRKQRLRKGYEFGRVGLSTKHTLAIVNRGGATAERFCLEKFDPSKGKRKIQHSDTGTDFGRRFIEPVK
jgi:hypothetical protein